MSNHVSQIPGYRLLSKQGGAEVYIFDGDCVCKQGDRIGPSEEVAMQLVKQHYPDFPIPEIEYSSYNERRGQIMMSYIPGSTVRDIWDQLTEEEKEKLCHETWDLVEQIRKIPKPENLKHLFLCAADGTASRDVLIADLSQPPTPLLSDEMVRNRICQRYYHFFGRRYTIEEMFAMLPRAEKSVFTHGDIAPQNILVDEERKIVGLLDWECAGWYPEYWEVANIWRPRNQWDWNHWMERTVRERWDLEGIKAARRVLF